jgi:predicted metal-dependent HD superfamily phosphohydrolase
VLQGFLARRHLYFTQRFQTQWEPAARANLARELAALTQAT